MKLPLRFSTVRLADREYPVQRAGHLLPIGVGLGASPGTGPISGLNRVLRCTLEVEDPMANLDWSKCPAVESIPGKVSGAWVFRGTRVPVSAIFENLKDSPMEEILENFHVTRDQIQTVLDFAAKSAETPVESLQT